MIVFPQYGGCFCGDVRYSLNEDPSTLYACHCTDCQRQTGTSFVLSMWVKEEALALLQGEPRRYEIRLTDGRPKRATFCGRCSTRLWGEPTTIQGFLVLRPGTLDDTSWLSPVAHIWTRSAQPWVPIPDDVLRFSGQPKGEEIDALVHAWKKRTPG